LGKVGRIIWTIRNVFVAGVKQFPKILFSGFALFADGKMMKFKILMRTMMGVLIILALLSQKKRSRRVNHCKDCKQKDGENFRKSKHDLNVEQWDKTMNTFELFSMMYYVLDEEWIAGTRISGYAAQWRFT
jgi:hypothetical protein